MKKYILICIFYILILASIFPENFGQKVYKQVIVNNEKTYRWVKLTGITAYNGKGKELYNKMPSVEIWREYDDAGNEIHYKNSRGFETWKEYDTKGNLIHM